MPSPIEHVIVLILENRSFDHMFGARHGVEGLQGNETNPAAPPFGGFPGTPVSVYIEPANPYFTIPDPKHEYENVCTQLFGTPTVPAPPVATNQGFVIAYAGETGPNGLINGPSIGRQAMQYFGPQQLPVLNRLAGEFVVCDRWHASVPGPTWPNRLFLHCASSGGLADSPSNFAAGVNALLGLYTMPTIYENLDKNGRTWRIYYHDPPQSLSLQYVNQRWATNMRSFSSFAGDVKQDDLPNYIVVEPNSGLFTAADANDMHPSHDVRKGEALIASIYDSLRDSDYWEKSLFVVVFDEHGGFHDHVPPPFGPPHAVPPDGNASANPPFRRSPRRC
jgi:phospholipase C